uniref:Peripheral subunit-binding (PSBD) domain-containing protein n=1 Tax=Ditylenchus dipsaci TaxID=166011 RepID=A0A915D2Z3_9BILA
MAFCVSPNACWLVRRSLSTSSSTQVLMGPAVRLMLHHYQLDPQNVKTTGPKNNLLKSDLLLHISEKKLSLAQHKSKPGQNYIDVPLTNMRSTIAKRLSSAKGSIPHSYLAGAISANKLLALRKMLAKDGVKVSVNDFLIKAAALSLRSVPQVNVQWKNESVCHVASVDVSVAVATPAGLITPIVFNADGLGIEQIADKVRELATRARDNKLKPDEFMGGTFTISNLGMFGISHFTAIINPPQTAILAVGGLETQINEQLQPESIFRVTLCFDARAIDELSAQRFLNSLQVLLADPEVMIMGSEKMMANQMDYSALL